MMLGPVHPYLASTDSFHPGKVGCGAAPPEGVSRDKRPLSVRLRSLDGRGRQSLVRCVTRFTEYQSRDVRRRAPA